MRKTILFTLLFEFVGSSLINAQLIKGYGIKLALTSAFQEFDYTNIDAPSRRRLGFNAGAYVEWLELPFFSLVTQCEYNQKGVGMDFAVTENDPTIIGTVTKYNRVDYLSFPILAKLMAPGGFGYLLAGPRIDYMLGYKSYDNLFNTVYDDFARTTFGVSVAVGIELSSLLQIPIMTEARYNIDLKDSYSTQFLKVRNSSFDLWLGVAL